LCPALSGGVAFSAARFAKAIRELAFKLVLSHETLY
jgi:hypothetical protein